MAAAGDSRVVSRRRLAATCRHLCIGAAAAAAPQQQQPATRRLRFGIIGLGDITAKSFAPSILRSDVCELVAVCRRDLASAQAFQPTAGALRVSPDCQAYASAAELCADPLVEAVVVATPSDTHAEYTILAAQHGKHVLCEKPMARDTTEARAMVDACRAANVSLGVAYRRRLFPQVVKARELIDRGDIGPVVCVRTHYSGDFPDTTGTWRSDPELGGALMEMACHRIEVLLNFGGPVASVSAMRDTVRKDRGWEVDDTDAMVCRFRRYQRVGD
jgi:predicted dehydrogenase